MRFIKFSTLASEASGACPYNAKRFWSFLSGSFLYESFRPRSFVNSISEMKSNERDLFLVENYAKLQTEPSLISTKKWFSA